jgi:hypothetical protein
MCSVLVGGETVVPLPSVPNGERAVSRLVPLADTWRRTGDAASRVVLLLAASGYFNTVTICNAHQLKYKKDNIFGIRQYKWIFKNHLQ